VPGLSDDGLHLPTIKRHSLEKIRRHNYYAALFAKAMKHKWPQRAYIGLYSGAGRARLADTGEIVETSALAVIRQEVPFTKYIFVDSDNECLTALEARVRAIDPGVDATFIPQEVDASVEEVIAAMPRYGRTEGGLLSLCFVDPFRVDLDFRVIKELSRFRIDFLVMLPLGFDVRRNLRRYLDDPEDKLGALIDSADWREEWRARGEPDRAFVRFVLMKFDQAMQRLGFRECDISRTVPVKVSGMGVYLYSLALYSRNELGEKFWKTTIAGTSPQLGLDL
jgi:three-Cys-motif partner protein